MSLKKRPSESFWVCFSFDPALVPVPDKDMREYLLTKDITKLPIDVNTKTVTLTGEGVALCRVKPMTRKAYEAWIGNPVALRTQVVREHVVEVHNIDGAKCERDRNTTEVCLTEESIDNMDHSVIDELFDAIHESSRGADGNERPFSLPASFVGDRLRSRQLSANLARIDLAAKKEEEQASRTSDSDQDSPSTDQ